MLVFPSFRRSGSWGRFGGSCGFGRGLSILARRFVAARRFSCVFLLLWELEAGQKKPSASTLHFVVAELGLLECFGSRGVRDLPLGVLVLAARLASRDAWVCTGDGNDEGL